MSTGIGNCQMESNPVVQENKRLKEVLMERWYKEEAEVEDGSEESRTEKLRLYTGEGSIILSKRGEEKKE
jgi:hypothetical protein